MIVVIHPMCAMEEYAMIFRSCVWFRPPHPPTMIDRSDIVSSKSRLMEGKIWYRTDKGAIFCHVNKIMPDVSEIPCVTSGTQKWNGESPSFITRAIVIRIDAVGFEILVMVH